MADSEFLPDLAVSYLKEVTKTCQPLEPFVYRSLNYNPCGVLAMEGMNNPPARAYVAPENVEEPLRYSGHVEQPDGRFEFSPVYDSLAEAVAWARERTNFVIAREVLGEYLWYGIGPAPLDIKAPPE